jgi:hypothetical protein
MAAIAAKNEDPAVTTTLLQYLAVVTELESATVSAILDAKRR